MVPYLSKSILDLLCQNQLHHGMETVFGTTWHHRRFRQWYMLAPVCLCSSTLQNHPIDVISAQKTQVGIVLVARGGCV